MLTLQMIFNLLLNLQISHHRIPLQFFNGSLSPVSLSDRARFDSSIHRNEKKIGSEDLAKSATLRSFRDSLSIRLAKEKPKKSCMYLYDR